MYRKHEYFGPNNMAASQLPWKLEYSTADISQTRRFQRPTFCQLYVGSACMFYCYRMLIYLIMKIGGSRP